jgi:hypothetical protein
MAQRAHVTSVDAIESFRSQLIIYLSKARPALEEVSADVLRMKLWLQNDQRLNWESQVRRRSKDLEEAQQALFSSRISILKAEGSAEQLAVHRAKRALDEAQNKLRILKNWNREFDNRVDPLVKQTEKLHTVLTNDMAQAVAYLGEAIKSLQAYAEMRAPTAGGVEGGSTSETPTPSETVSGEVK